MRGLKGIEPFYFTQGKDGSDFCTTIAGCRIAKPDTLRKYLTSRIIIIGEPKIDAQENLIAHQSIDWEFKTLLDKDSIYTELRFLEPIRNQNIKHLIPSSFILPYENIIVDTSFTDDILFSNLSESKKRQVTSSLKAGAFVRKAESENEVDMLYDLLSSLYRKKVRKPLLPVEVFRRFFQDKTLGEIFVVIFNNNIVGGIVCPVYQKEEMYEWYITGSDEAMKKERVYPSVLATWEAIRYASVNGYKRFNFMGAGQSDQPYGVRDFKLQFGGQLVEAPRYYIIHKPILFRLGKLAIKLGLGNL